MRRVLVLAGLAVVLTGCGSGTVGAGNESPAPAGPDDLLVRVTEAGGLLAPGARLGSLPLVSVSGDGRVLRPGPQIAIYPPPALPSIEQLTLPVEDAQRLATDAYAAGVDGTDRDYGRPAVADMTTTVFTARHDGRLLATRVYALGADTAGLSPSQLAARRRLVALRDRLTGLSGQSRPYDFTRLAVLARPYDPHEAAGAGVRPGTTAWRGPDPAAGSPLAGGRCLVLAGADLDAVRADLQRASQLTRWTYGAGVWRFTLRPLLPDERTCADLGAAG